MISQDVLPALKRFYSDTNTCKQCAEIEQLECGRRRTYDELCVELHNANFKRTNLLRRCVLTRAHGKFRGMIISVQVHTFIRVKNRMENGKIDRKLYMFICDSCYSTVVSIEGYAYDNLAPMTDLESRDIIGSLSENSA